MEKTGMLYDKFLDEYVSEDAVRKYTTETAGYGITYLLRNEYARIYMDVVDSFLRNSTVRPVRLLEFGCGGGMNITRLVSLLEEKQLPVACAYGTDFSPRLVQAARQEAKAFLPPRLAEKLSFCVARNEELMRDLAAGLGEDGAGLLRSDRRCQYLPVLPSPWNAIGLCPRHLPFAAAGRGLHQHRYEQPFPCFSKPVTVFRTERDRVLSAFA